MYKIATIIAFLIFTLYWGATFFFDFPDNPIKIDYAKMQSHFENIFFQRWAYFAPPPKFNIRLYFKFKDKDTSKKEKVFEVLRPITLAKEDKAPFNREDEIMDYIISGSVEHINNSMFKMDKELKLNSSNMTDSLLYIKASDAVTKLAKSSLQTILNYAYLVALNNNIKPTRTKVKIIITTIGIAKFANRYKEKKIPEKRVYESEYLNIRGINNLYYDKN